MFEEIVATLSSVLSPTPSDSDIQNVVLNLPMPVREPLLKSVTRCYVAFEEIEKTGTDYLSFATRIANYFAPQMQILSDANNSFAARLYRGWKPSDDPLKLPAFVAFQEISEQFCRLPEGVELRVPKVFFALLGSKLVDAQDFYQNTKILPVDSKAEQAAFLMLSANSVIARENLRARVMWERTLTAPLKRLADRMHGVNTEAEQTAQCNIEFGSLTLLNRFNSLPEDKRTAANFWLLMQGIFDPSRKPDQLGAHLELTAKGIQEGRISAALDENGQLIITQNAGTVPYAAARVAAFTATIMDGAPSLGSGTAKKSLGTGTRKTNNPP